MIDKDNKGTFQFAAGSSVILPASYEPSATFGKFLYVTSFEHSGITDDDGDELWQPLNYNITKSQKIILRKGKPVIYKSEEK